MATRKKTLTDFHRKAKVIIDKIAKERDVLRDLIGEYTDILGSIEQSHDDLETALETLSQYL